MDTRKLINDAPSVLATLHEMEDNSLVTSHGCKIYIPSRFTERGLAFLGAEIYITGFCGIVVDNHYSNLMINAMCRIDPAETNRVTVNGDEYLEFVFYPGSVVITNLNLAKTDTLVYRMYDEVIAKANVPWYYTYFDLARIFDTAILHAGASIGNNREITELLVSIMARNNKQRHEYYRQFITSDEDLRKIPPYYASLKDVTLSSTNALHRLGGSYFRNGTISAINSPTERPERLEELLFG